MNRANFIRQSAFTMAALSLGRNSLLANIWEDPWKITMLRNDIGIFTEKGGTIAFRITKKGIVVVDAQFPEQSAHLITELKKKSTQPFSRLINTHHHGDHTAGNISFKGIAEHVLAHANSRINQENVAKQSKTEDKQLYPDQTFTDKWREKIAKEWITLYYFGAGHTNGDSLVHFEHGNVVHMGDLVFNRRHPYVDRGAGANMKSWMQVLDKALATFSNETLYVFGHSGPGYEVTGSAADIRAYRDYLGLVLKFVEAEMKAGKTKDEILKATLIPGAEDWKTDGIQRPLGAAYDELMAGK